MRLILGLDRPTRGTATINGRAYADIERPLTEVGALLEARAVHSGRIAHNHLLVLAQTQGIRASRVDEVHRAGRAAPTSPASAPAPSRSAWASAWASPPRCSATRRR